MRLRSAIVVRMQDPQQNLESGPQQNLESGFLAKGPYIFVHAKESMSCLFYVNVID